MLKRFSGRQGANSAGAETWFSSTIPGRRRRDGHTPKHQADCGFHLFDYPGHAAILRIRCFPLPAFGQRPRLVSRRFVIPAAEGPAAVLLPFGPDPNSVVFMADLEVTNPAGSFFWDFHSGSGWPSAGFSLPVSGGCAFAAASSVRLHHSVIVNPASSAARVHLAACSSLWSMVVREVSSVCMHQSFRFNPALSAATIHLAICTSVGFRVILGFFHAGLLFCRMGTGGISAPYGWFRGGTGSGRTGFRSVWGGCRRFRVHGAGLSASGFWSMN